MFNSKLIYTLFAVLLVVVALCNNVASSNLGSLIGTKEGFLGTNPKVVPKLESVAAKNPQDAAKGYFYSTPPNFQGMISPRFFNGNYGAYITYNPPANANLAVPSEPLYRDASPSSFKNMASEGYRKTSVGQSNGGQPVKESYGCFAGNCGATPPTCGKGGLSPASFQGAPPMMDSNFADGNYNNAISAAESNYPQALSMLPVSNLASNVMGCGPEGCPDNTDQVVMQNRLIYANYNSKYRKYGDKFRGDLAIVPIPPSCTQWFRPSVAPNIDLEPGAMNVMAGPNNENALALAALINSSSAGTETAIGGMNMAPQRNTFLSASQNDISVTAFP